jgi:hypothetical protein
MIAVGDAFFIRGTWGGPSGVCDGARRGWRFACVTHVDASRGSALVRVTQDSRPYAMKVEVCEELVRAFRAARGESR